MSSVTKARRQTRLSRTLGIALTPKAKKYFDRRPYPPGEHGRGRRKLSDYGIRLKEKQRLRAQYALKEKNLRTYYEKARHLQGLTGEVMVELIESRLDSLVLRAGFARTIYQARQAVTHRHILVDGEILDRPSARIRPGQTIQVKPKSQALTPFQVAALGAHQEVLSEVPEYLDVVIEKLTAVLKNQPKRAQVPIICDVALVVEYYAR